MAQAKIDWDELANLAGKLGQPGTSPGSVPQTEWDVIARALDRFVAAQDWEEVLRLRRLYAPLMARDSVTAFPLFRRLSHEGIRAAEKTENTAELADILAAEGHNLHRQGYHREAIEVFERASGLFETLGESFRALENFYMTALCYRALENYQQAGQVLEAVLQQIDKDDLWRGNPLQVMAWLAQDEGRLPEAEALLREALTLYRQIPEADIQVVGVLADLGEVVGLQGRPDEARQLFEESLVVLEPYVGQYDRQETRTRLKLAELLVRQGQYDPALQLLNQADDKIRPYGHYYDLMWRIETLRAFAFFRQRRWGSALRKLRMALSYRRQIGLSNIAFAKQLVKRLNLGIGLPR